jgi:hypothetical protein
MGIYNVTNWLKNIWFMVAMWPTAEYHDGDDDASVLLLNSNATRPTVEITLRTCV